MRVLAVVHGEEVRSGVFADPIAARGHELEEWSIARRPAPSRPLDAYSAVIVFGGSMHADQDDRHPWLREETLFLHRLLDSGTPVLGVCLGAQLLARAAHAPVEPAREPEIGWYEIELTAEAADDPVLSRLPSRFHALQWHFYTYGVPAGAVELARSAVCTQAFRLGEVAWGIQFHAEVSPGDALAWIDDAPNDPDAVAAKIDVQALREQTEESIEAWTSPSRRCARTAST